MNQEDVKQQNEKDYHYKRICPIDDRTAIVKRLSQHHRSVHKIFLTFFSRVQGSMLDTTPKACVNNLAEMKFATS